MYQFILAHIILPLGDLFARTSFTKQFRNWNKMDALSAEELEQIQQKNLKKLLQFAVLKVPAYQHIFLEGTIPEKWLQQFPVLTKQVLRNNYKNLLTQDEKKLIKYSSSGSSGFRSVVFMNKHEQAAIRAIQTHCWAWSGYQLGDAIVQTGISPQRGVFKKVKDLLFRTVYVTAFSMSNVQLKALCETLQKASKKYYLIGYASSLSIVAKYAIENNFDIRLKAVVSLGDKLFSAYQKNITKAFLCKVFDTYGCNEGFFIASQKDLSYKYIMTPHVYLEIVDDHDQPVKDGEMGHVVVTRLDGFSMPLIRYKNGDLAIKLPKEQYPEKRDFNYPLLQQIVGRESDVVHLLDGKKLVVHSFTGIFEYISAIKQFQVRQNQQGEITILYLKTKEFTPSILDVITEKLQSHIQDPNFIIRYKEVTSIKDAASGKPEIIVNTLLKKSSN